MTPDVCRLLFHRSVLLAFAVQVVSYAALLSVFSVHGEVTAVLRALRVLPAPVLVALSIPALPAVALSVALASGIQFVTGISPFDLGTVLLTPGDAIVFLTAYFLAVGAVVGRRTLLGVQTERTKATDR